MLSGLAMLFERYNDDALTRPVFVVEVLPFASTFLKALAEKSQVGLHTEPKQRAIEPVADVRPITDRYHRLFFQ